MSVGGLERAAASAGVTGQEYPYRPVPEYAGAFEARELTGTVLLPRPDLMRRWREASEAGLVVAVTQDQRNYALVKDVDLFADLREAGGADLKAYAVDDQGRVRV